jgi:muramoyltetrapeptide carboxypeptidase LdcA involved in peptidoglycan recycling
MEFVRQNWGWDTLHAPMPSLRSFSVLPERDVEPLKAWLNRSLDLAPGDRSHPQACWQGQTLAVWVPPFSGRKKRKDFEGPLVGGNLSVLTALLGTPDEPRWRSGSLLFLEEVDEPLYRIDRFLQQLGMSRAFRGIRAVVLGSFLGCQDRVPGVLLKSAAHPRLQDYPERLLRDPQPHELQPLRPVLEPDLGLKKVFADWGQRVRRPIFFGLPVGHGPDFAPLPLGAVYRLSPEGRFELRPGSW